MDALSSVLTGPAARGAFVLRCSLQAPWAIRIEDDAPVNVLALVRGHAYVCPDGAEPVLLRAGDVAVARGNRHYRVADAVDTPAQVRIDPGQVCVSLAGPDTPPMSDVGVRTWGNANNGATLMLNGTYESPSTVGQRVLRSLPDLIVAPREHVPTALVGYLAEQISSDEPGQDAVLDRMLDLILIAVLRWWFAQQEHDGGGWYGAYADPAIGRALRLMQEYPAVPWTVARLGAETGLSRAAFARRFSGLVGEPPMTFLTNWRLSLAADLLTEPGATVGSVAPRRVRDPVRLQRGVQAAARRQSGAPPADREHIGGSSGREVDLSRPGGHTDHGDHDRLRAERHDSSDRCPGTLRPRRKHLPAGETRRACRRDRTCRHGGRLRHLTR